MHINSSVSNLIGGVSQQPELLRLPSHLKAQENGYSTPSKGLSKRPATAHLGNVTAFTGSGFHTTIDYGSRGIFHLNVEPTTGTIRMATASGVAKPLYNAGGLLMTASAYLWTATPETSLRLIKEADTCFLINMEVTATETITPAAATTWPALVWIKAGNYGRTYSVGVPGYGTATYTTPDGSTAAHTADTRTNVIAANLAAGLAGLGVPGVTSTGSVINIPPGSMEGITADDGAGGQAVSLVYKTIRSIAELPSRNATNGFYVKVEGGDATAAGDHYLSYIEGQNVYRETRNPTEAWGTPNPATLPHSLVPYLDGFKLAPLSWGGRNTGDSSTNPAPSFVGKPVTDLYFYQDRMGLLSGECYDLSEVGEYYNFYRTTVLDLLDADPVSGVVSHPKVATLRHAIPFNKRLLFFSDKAQFELAAGDFLTPKTVATRQLTEFECSSAVRPIGMGTSLYFPVDKGDHSAFFNFFVSGADSLEDATDISGHIPQYVPRNVSQVATSPVNNLFMALSRNDKATLYVYQFYQDGPSRLQSAWHKWPMGAGVEILSIAVADTRLLLLVKRTTAAGVVVSSEAMELSTEPNAYRLDRKVKILPGAIAVAGEGLLRTTTLTLPYKPGVGVYSAVVTAGTAATKAGTVVTLTTSPESLTATVMKNLEGCTLEVGLGYRFKGTLGRFMVREQAGAGSAGISRGRTQIGRLWVNYADAATFAVEVASEGRAPVLYKATGRLLGTSSARVGEPALGDGRFGCPVLAENTKVEISLINDTPLPSSFLSVDWEGYHVARGQHV